MRHFLGTARASGCPEDRNILWTSVSKTKLQEQNRGCMKIRLEVRKHHPADGASALPRGSCLLGSLLSALSNTWALRCLAEPRCLSSAPHMGSKRSPQRSSFMSSRTRGSSFPWICALKTHGWVLRCPVQLCACITISLSRETSGFLSSLCSHIFTCSNLKHPPYL